MSYWHISHRNLHKRPKDRDLLLWFLPWDSRIKCWQMQHLRRGQRFRTDRQAGPGVSWQPGVLPACFSGLQYIVWSRLSCMATEALWVPGSHSHRSHIRLIKSDSRPASWLTQFALIRFPFHAEHTHAQAWMCAQTQNQQRVGQYPMSSNEKQQKKPLPWQLPAYIFRRTQISCLTAIVLFWFSFDSRGIPRRISSPLARIYAKSPQIKEQPGSRHAENLQPWI